MDMLKNRLTVTLDRLGATSRTRLPEKAEKPLDKALHEFTVASFLRSYGEKRYDAAKKALIKLLPAHVSTALQGAVTLVSKTKNVNTIELVDADVYHAVAQVNPGNSFLDSEGLLLALKLTYPNLADEFEAMFKKYTRRRDPTVTYVVANKLEKVDG